MFFLSELEQRNLMASPLIIPLRMLGGGSSQGGGTGMYENVVISRWLDVANLGPLKIWRLRKIPSVILAG